MPVSRLFLECWNFLYIGRHINIKHQNSFLSALFFAVTNLNRLERCISFLESKTGPCHRLFCLTITEQRDEPAAVSSENSKHQMWRFAGASVVKSLPPVQEMRVWSLGREDLLEKEVATHSSVLAWEMPWTEEPDGLQSTGWRKSQIQLSD